MGVLSAWKDEEESEAPRLTIASALADIQTQTQTNTSLQLYRYTRSVRKKGTVLTEPMGKSVIAEFTTMQKKWAVS
jgi:hypothetical protein